MATSKKDEFQTTAKLYPLRPPRPCPECGKPSTREAYPFCSERCRAIDLNRWLNGAYILPGKPLNNADEQE
ncbi:DNA gyrase inhibitor YacG [uncultured Bartonella sp.]|uniref:DNA gyrase inhibitor YacG n=1 Tax=uncultured Bartonella sp. TaxID=104108 RepID=UPI0025E8C1D3|nr:DNA gyrase inhibitor YacG [uncultured Bartonella sp.]